MKPDLHALSVYMDESFTNFQEAGSLKKKTDKVYIQIKTSSKTYLVRRDTNNNKYILINNKKTLLKSIKGQYIYHKK